MNIVHVLSSLRIGGQERVALDLAAGQQAAGHTVTVVSLAPPPDGPLAEGFRAAGVRVERVAKRDSVDPTLPARLWLMFRHLGARVVHMHNRMPLIYGAPPGRLLGAVLIHTRHGPRQGTKRELWLRRGVGRLVDAHVAVSPALAELALKLRDCPPEQLSVIKNGIDLTRFRPDAEARRATRAQLGIPADAWVVGSVGRLAFEKNYALLVRAVAPLLGDKGRLLLVGDGADEATIRAEAVACGVEAFVHLPGATNDTAPFLAALDVFALSSRMEGLPLAALEAMSTGLPVVATAVGGLPHLIQEGVNGYLVPAGDERALGARLAALRADRATAAAVAERGRAHVHEHHSREAMVKRYLELYALKGAGA